MTVERKPCYGNMFPDVIAPVDTGLHSGTVFSFEIENFGLSRAKRRVDVNPDSWEECRRCPDFEHCYKLSMGKLTLQSAIMDA